MIRQRNIYKIIFIFLAVFIMTGCGGMIPPSDGYNPEQKDKPTDSSRGYNPLELMEDREIVPEKYPQEGDIIGQIISVDSADQVIDTSGYVVEGIPDEIDTLNSQSFRVQLFSSKVYSESKNALRVAEEIFDRPLFLDYEVPYYKLRVGNFQNRDKAEEYQMRCKAAGYNTAWIVAVNVKVKEAAPLYKDLILPEIIDSVFYYEQQDSILVDENDEFNDEK